MDSVCTARGLSRGRRSNEQELEVRWRLEEFRGQTVRLLVDDGLSEAWGFVGVRGFQLQ